MHDWRESFYGYDCCFKTVEPLSRIIEYTEPIIVICFNDITLLKKTIKILIESKIYHIPAVFDVISPYTPIEQELPFSKINANARSRAISVNSSDRLFNLLQLVRETEEVPGDIVEFGSYGGGSGAIIVETLGQYNINKSVWLFDSYEGLPKPEIGVDYRWKTQFMDVSYAEVKASFSDSKNVKCIKGPFHKTIDKVSFPVSFAHIDNDTYGGAKIITEHLWPLLSPRGILLYDDYGFFPNCLPLTVFVDDFFESRKDCFKFHLPSNGYFVIKI